METYPLVNAPLSLLEIDELTLDFAVEERQMRRVLDGVSLRIAPGEVLGLVGESGSGKTVLSHAILGLLPNNGRISSGSIRWKGQNMATATQNQWSDVRGRGIAMIFQDPQASLNPVYSIECQFRWLLKIHREIIGHDAKEEASRLLRCVQLDEPARVLASLPSQLSGGMCQRVMIALALACSPSLLIADEPTSALDRVVQLEIVELLRQVNIDSGLAVLLITHDLGVARRMCHRLAVLENGAIVETGKSPEIFSNPQHPYTNKLIEASRRLAA